MNVNSISSQPNQENLLAGKVQLQTSVPQNLTNVVGDAQPVQVQFNDVVKAALLEMIENIGQRAMLLASLPSEIKQVVSTILKENAAGTNEMAKGLTAMLQTQKQAADKLIDLSEVLGSAVLYRQEEKLSPALIKAILLFGTMHNENLGQSKDLVLEKNELSDIAGQLPNKGSEENKQIPASIRQILSQLFSEEEIKNLTNRKENSRQIKDLANNSSLDIPEQIKFGKSFEDEQIPASVRQIFSQLFSKEEIWSNPKESGNIMPSEKSSEGEKQVSTLIKQLLPKLFSENDIQTLKASPKFRELFSTLEQQIPENIQQAALKLNLPELVEASILLNVRSVLSRKELLLSKLTEMLNNSVADQENLKADSLLTSLKVLENFAPENRCTADDILLLVSKSVYDSQSEGKGQLLAQAKQLLQQLFSGDNTQILSKETAGIRNLFSRLNQQVPQDLLQFAEENHLPKLTDAYILLKMQDVMQWKDMDENILRECAKKLRNLSASLQSSITANSGETSVQQTIAAYSMPIYFDESSKPYPLYIHVYSEGNPQGQKTLNKGRDVWMRVALQTENIGMVDIFLHLFGERRLSLKVDFSQNDYAKSFLDFVPSIQTHINELAINIADIHIRSNLAE